MALGVATAILVVICSLVLFGMTALTVDLGDLSPVRVLVAGGGATGCEIAANIATLAERHAGRADCCRASGT